MPGNGKESLLYDDDSRLVRQTVTMPLTLPGTLSIVDSKTAGTNGSGNVTLTFTAGAVQSGDCVVFFGAYDSHGPNGVARVITPGYTQIAFVDQGVDGATAGVWHKCMGATPDTSVVGGGSGSTLFGVNYGYYVIRGLPLGALQTATTTVHKLSGYVDPGTVNALVTNSFVLVVVAHVLWYTTPTAPPTGYGNMIARGQNDSWPSAIAAAVKTVTTPGPENPGMFTWSATYKNQTAFTIAIPSGTPIINDSLTYDQRGKVLRRKRLGTPFFGDYSYTGLGYLAYSDEALEYGATNRERYELDGLGNIRATERDVFGDLPDIVTPNWRRFENAIAEGQIYSTEEVWNQPSPPAEPSPWYPRLWFNGVDARNRQGLVTEDNFAQIFDEDTYESQRVGWSRRESKSFYGPDDKVMFHQVNRADSAVTVNPQDHFGVFEDYWYDALGRRVMVLSRQESTLCEINARCDTHTDRFIWDGDQLLYDLRSDGISEAVGNNIVYIHAGGTDQPVGMIRNGTPLVLHHNYRGLPAAATDTTGAHTTCQPGESPDVDDCDDVRWPAGSWISTLAPHISNTTPDWYGSLSVAFRDDTGNLYRRNRYYDPTQGQFTQADPIGIAGGLNLYGYAGGDPINSSDPFGLCPPADDNFSDCNAFSQGWFGHRVATGQGSEFVNQVGGVLAAAWETLNENQCPECLTGVVPSVGGPGTRIVGIGRHALRQASERGITPAMISAAQRLGQRYIDPKNKTFNYVLREGFASGKDLLVGVRIGQPNFVTTAIRGADLVLKRFIPYP
jgi:RHS repeat-associated protein